MYLKTLKMFPNLIMVKDMITAHKLYRQLEGNLVMVVDTEEVFVATPLVFKTEGSHGRKRKVAYGYFVQIYGAEHWWEEMAIRGREIAEKINMAVETQKKVTIEQKTVTDFQEMVNIKESDEIPLELGADEDEVENGRETENPFRVD